MNSVLLHFYTITNTSLHTVREVKLTVMPHSRLGSN